MLDGLISYLLLPLGGVLGYALSRNRKAGASSQALSSLSQLANENTEAAIESLASTPEHDPAADELNLTLGALFRKRGEIDRALRLHEGVLAHAANKPELKPLVLLELGQDYAKAGLTDRAEEALKECARHPPLAVSALEHLLPLHEQHGDWQQALDAAHRLQGLKGQSTVAVRAHYWCELSEAARAEKDAAKALGLVQKALQTDPTCVRAHLLHSSLLEAAGELPQALAAAVRIPDHDARFLPEVLPVVSRICEASQQPETFAELLVHFEGQHAQEPAVWLARAALLPSEQRAEFLAEKLAQRPSWRGLVEFLGQPVAQEAGTLSTPVAAFRDALVKATAKKPRYRCTHCGFTPSLLFWKCPSCKQWGTVVPAEDTL